MSYRGRFAPTPSGPLHMGSLFTALASYLQARAKGGQWLLRIDDLDTPRNAPGAIDVILRQLESHGLLWDETPRCQSRHLEQYRAALETLLQGQWLYGCHCTRAQLARTSWQGPDGPVYPGTCRKAFQRTGKHALRLRVNDAFLFFDDLLMGRQLRQMEKEVGDFVVQRSDGIIGYQLACAVDEVEQRISEVIRGADLLDSTFRQLQVQQCLHLPQARYGHLPVLLQPDGRKLSKQNHATAIDASRASENLHDCLAALGQEPPAALQGARPVEILGWAARHWDLARVPTQSTLKWSNEPASGIL